MTGMTTKESPKNEAPAPAGSAAPEPPWDPLISLRSQVDRLFEDFAGGWPMAQPGGRGGMLAGFGDWPGKGSAVDIVDLDKAIEVRAELPGMEEKEIDIELSGRMLTIRGEKKAETEKGETGTRYYMSERRYGAVARTLQIPEGADCDRPEARFANGVLTVSFPKTKVARETARKIRIRNG